MDPNRTGSSDAVRPGPIVFPFNIKTEGKKTVFCATKEPPGTQVGNLRHLTETVQISINNQGIQHNMDMRLCMMLEWAGLCETNCVSNKLDADQVQPGLGPICLRRLWVEDTSRQFYLPVL